MCDCFRDHLPVASSVRRNVHEMRSELLNRALRRATNMKEVMKGNTCDKTHTHYQERSGSSLHALKRRQWFFRKRPAREKEVCKRFVVHPTTVGPAPDMHVRTDFSDVLARCRTGAREVPYLLEQAARRAAGFNIKSSLERGIP